MRVEALVAVRLKLEIWGGHAALEEAPATEAARIVREVADKIELGDAFEGILRDLNGNACGSFQFDNGEEG